MFGLGTHEILFAAAVTLVAGFVKGAVGFAMPTIMMSAFASFLPAPTALGLLVMPTLATNLQQALRQGLAAAWNAIWKYRWHIVPMTIFIFVSAPFARILPAPVMYLALGIPITVYSLWQLSGRKLTLPERQHRRAEVITGIIGGLYGGISGIWGPPLIVYLLSIAAPKDEQIRAQGVVFTTGAIALLVAHLGSGVLNGQTWPLSLLLVIPGFVGMQIGFAVHDRLDAGQFRRWTLILLVLTSLNLIRRALTMEWT